MISKIALVAVLVCAVTASFSAPNPKTPYPEQYYGYIPINKQYESAMFYGIRGNPNETFRRNAPLIMWLQGGPGATSFFGDFLENGPTTLFASNNTNGYAFRDNKHSWTQHATMLYVDNPVGTGFSYTKDPAGFSTNDTGIADNLVTFLKGFLAEHPEYSQNRNDFWVFCESYGGKMTAFYGAALIDAINNYEISVNFKGVALGDGWVSPIDCMKSYGDYLKGFSQVNQAQLQKINDYANYAQSALEQGKGFDATNYWSAQQTIIGDATANLNWYNTMYYYDYTADGQLTEFLSSQFTQQLGSIIPSGVSFGTQSGEVFNQMGGAFMMDGISKVDHMLNNGLEVHVYGGQLDLIVDVLCIERWMAKLTWPNLPSFQQAARNPLYVGYDQNVQVFQQNYDKLTYWQVMKAGHMVPLDNPAGAELMMTKIIGADGSKIKPNPSEEEIKGRVRKPHPRGKAYRP